MQEFVNSKAQVNLFNMLLITILVFILHDKELRNLVTWSSILQVKKKNNKEQLINQNTNNTNINNVNGKSEISVTVNCINNFENNNSATKDTDNMDEIINKNVDMESNKQKENAENNIRTKEKVIRIVSENSKNTPLEKISENDKTHFKCNFEND